MLGHETVNGAATDPVGTTEGRYLMSDEEDETQNTTKPQDNTMPNNELISEGSVLNTESSEELTDSSAATIPKNDTRGIG